MTRHFGSATKSRHIVRQAIVLRDATYGVPTITRWRDKMKLDLIQGLGIPLSDALLDPADVCEWLRQLLHVVAMRALFHEDFAMALAQSLSISRTDLWKIRPLPGAFCQWLSSGLIAEDNKEEICYDEVRPGEWTVLLLVKGKSRSKTIFNYAFLTREQDGHLVIADIKDFYRLAVGQQGQTSEAKQLAILEEQIRDLQASLHTSCRSDEQVPPEAKPDDILKLSSKDEVMEVISELSCSH